MALTLITSLLDAFSELAYAMRMPLLAVLPYIVSVAGLVAPVLDVFEVSAQVTIVMVSLMAVTMLLDALLTSISRFVFGSHDQKTQDAAKESASDLASRSRGSVSAHTTFRRLLVSFRRLL